MQGQQSFRLGELSFTLGPGREMGASVFELRDRDVVLLHAEERFERVVVAQFPGSHCVSALIGRCAAGPARSASATSHPSAVCHPSCPSCPWPVVSSSWAK